MLPDEISLHILSYLDEKSLRKASYVSKSWKILSEDDNLWHNLFNMNYHGVVIVPSEYSEYNWKLKYYSVRAVYPSINSALSHASPDDSIIIPPGTYYESVNITQPLQIIGDTHNRTFFLSFPFSFPPFHPPFSSLPFSFLLPLHSL